MLVCLGSTNPVKLKAVKDALEEIGLGWEVKEVDVDSGVDRQPFCEETMAGARNRALKVMEDESCNLGVGIEGGICFIRNRLMAYAVVYVIGRDQRENFSFSPAFSLPNNLAKLVLEGRELGEATDILYGRRDSKKAEGAVGVLTGIIDRARLYKDSVILALYPFYSKGS
ncbi:inosine/xanthosine triphosphatase [Metallosphaera tengchongensis]|uniref:Probable inosine/xanthosine triphosphatase n=1 Tax=Metallosphaera tengchongensis TaxID=1532350 RepID=A0A6N0NXU8_9CREN|nr:inosine/xanthosine triphosphatase [Metallosphaera tengchongensis]QKR01087.1 inosine/xanthosine triphosphatase [Metallosphaera tengchongensis]